MKRAKRAEAAKPGASKSAMGQKRVPGRKSDAVADTLWREYKRDHSPASREELILHYAPLVKYVAGRVSSGLPPSVEFAELVSYGVFGLLDAIEKYDHERGIKFETYAIARIKGAIIDELRADDWVPRSIRSRAREIERVYVALEGELRRIPTDEEVAARLGMSLAEYTETLGKLSFISIVALDELWTVSGDRPDKISLADTVEDVKVKDPSQTFELEEMKDMIADAINRLPERERIIVTLYYYEGLTMREIGEVLGVTESRVCQMHTKAILRLRPRLGAAMGVE